MIATTAVNAVIAEKTKRSAIAAIIATIWKPRDFPSIAATTIAEIEKVLSQRSLSLRSLESGFLVIAAIAELFLLSDRSDHMETRLKLRIFNK